MEQVGLEKFAVHAVNCGGEEQEESPLYKNLFTLCSLCMSLDFSFLLFICGFPSSSPPPTSLAVVLSCSSVKV